MVQMLQQIWNEPVVLRCYLPGHCLCLTCLMTQNSPLANSYVANYKAAVTRSGAGTHTQVDQVGVVSDDLFYTRG